MSAPYLNASLLQAPQDYRMERAASGKGTVGCNCPQENLTRSRLWTATPKIVQQRIALASPTEETTPRRFLTDVYVPVPLQLISSGHSRTFTCPETVGGKQHQNRVVTQAGPSAIASRYFQQLLYLLLRKCPRDLVRTYLRRIGGRHGRRQIPRDLRPCALGEVYRRKLRRHCVTPCRVARRRPGMRHSRY